MLGSVAHLFVQLLSTLLQLLLALGLSDILDANGTLYNQRLASFSNDMSRAYVCKFGDLSVAKRGGHTGALL